LPAGGWRLAAVRRALVFKRRVLPS